MARFARLLGVVLLLHFPLPGLARPLPAEPAGESPPVGCQHDAWVPMTTVNAPSARNTHTAVWTGNLMIVWGGTTETGDTNTGGRYDPLTDTWTATSTVNAPTPRREHSAVWTGSEMIVWSGFDPSTNTGGRYDPIGDAWTPTSTTDAPVTRLGHTAVWTGTEMIIWGGLGSSPAYPRIGARYDPVTDTWTPTTQVHAPRGRYRHAAVWTGDRMIVWGGNNDPKTLFTDTGGVYDPLTDTWQATSDMNAPVGRWEHTAVWTGSAVLIWGGQDSSRDYRADGGSYDPGTDTWSPLPVFDSPDPRMYHSAVWTGREMVVWGGTVEGNEPTQTGGRYNPVTDAWATTSLVDAPAPRTISTAVPTGTQMLVWGGWPFEVSDAGGIYTVDIDGDGVAGPCDCAPGDPGASAVPSEVSSLDIAIDAETLTWDSAAPGAGSDTVHDLLRGGFDGFPVGGGGAEVCLASGASGTSGNDPAVPATGAGLWYLVRGRNVCGAGTYGPSSDGTERVSAGCP